MNRQDAENAKAFKAYSIHDAVGHLLLLFKQSNFFLCALDALAVQFIFLLFVPVSRISEQTGL